MYKYLQRLSRYEVISFTTGFALMAYELAAARVLAPSIGSSTYVWTSVIGVIIAALSLGYAVGGKLADARVQALDVVWLLLASAGSAAVTLIWASYVLEVLTLSGLDPRLQGLVASLLLFAPTSFVLGAISPYLVRLRVVSLKTSGESVALLSAVNSVGGIAGTFATGFVFFGFLGSKETMIVVTTLLLLSSWLILPRRKVRQRGIASLAIVAVAVSPFFMVASSEAVVADIDTPSAHYRVHEGSYANRPVRLLQTGPNGFQSAVYVHGQRELVFDYTRKMAEVVAEKPDKQRILMLGGGAFTLPEHLAREYPGAQIDVVEIDPQLEEISREYFKYSAPDNVRLIAEDARAFLNKNATRYDVILVDVYSDTAVPFSLVTREYTVEVARALQPDGVVAVNIIAASNATCQPLLGAIHAAYKGILPETVLFGMQGADLRERQNIIAVYGESLGWLDKAGASKVAIAPQAMLTDNFAPTERLQERCRGD